MLTETQRLDTEVKLYFASHEITSQKENMETYLVGIGKRIKRLRKSQYKTINQISMLAGVTPGLISRIENGRTIPSLPVFFSIVNALKISLPEFFNGIPDAQNQLCIVSRKNEQQEIEKEDGAIGFRYNHIFGKQLSSVGFECVFLEIQPDSHREQISTDAYEFKYIISGSCTYNIGDQEVILEVGDSLFFDGRLPHVPKNHGNDTLRMLVVYFFI